MRPLGRTLKRCAVLATNPRQRDQWLRGRFLSRAARYTPVVAVDDHRGNRYFLDPGDVQVGRSLFTLGSFDLDKIEYAVAELSGIAITQVLDIGANIGTTIIELLSRFPNATGFAFEPDAKNFQLLSHNVAANGLSMRVAVRQFALSDTDGEVVLEMSPDNLGDHRVRTGTLQPGVFDEHRRRTTRVPAFRLDTLIENGDLQVNAGTLVYMDAQGHEGHILAGASGLLDAGCHVVLEFWPYGLRRAGGYAGLVEIMARYGHIVTLDDRRTSTQAGDIDDLTRRLGATGHVDLMLIP